MQENSITTASDFRSRVRGKNVVYITVKDESYIRVTQIQRLLEKEALSVCVYSSEKENPVTRALDLRKRIKKISFEGTDVIVMGFLPQLIWGSVVKRLQRDSTRPVLMAEMFLSLYDTVILERKMFRDGWWISGLMRRLDSKVVNEADLVLTDTRANAEFISSLYGADKGRFETLYLEADEEIYGATEGDGEKAGPFRVLYFGTGLPLQGTDVVMEAFDRAASPKGNILCTYIGSIKGIPYSILNSAAANRNVHILKWLSQSNLARKIAEADLCIAGHFNLYIDKAARTIPGKAFIYEAMDKPMILGDTKANRELFKEDERHIFVRRGDAEALAECIKKYLS